MNITIQFVDDEPNQFLKIEKVLQSFQEEAGFGIGIERKKRIIHLKGTKAWEIEVNDFKEELATNNTDIIVLDHDIRWGEDEQPFNSDRIASLIKEVHGKNSPYIIMTSNKFEKGDNAKELLKFFTENNDPLDNRLITINKKEFNLQEYHDTLFEKLEKVVSVVEAYKPSIQLEYYDLPNDFEQASDFRHHATIEDLSEKKLADGQIIKERKTVPRHQIKSKIFGQDQILAFYYYKHDFGMVYLDTNDGQCVIRLGVIIHDPPRGLKADFIRKLEKARFSSFEKSTNPIYNKSYFYPTGKDNPEFNDPHKTKELYVLKRGIFEGNQENEMLRQLQKQIMGTRRIANYKGDGSDLKDNLLRVNPFYPVFRKFLP